MSITSMLLSGEYTKDNIAEMFGISLLETQQIKNDMVALIEDVRISCEQFQEKLQEIDAFYSPITI